MTANVSHGMAGSNGLELLFHGAARQVTGSMHYFRWGNDWIALDCGLYQGHRRQAAEANRRFLVRPQELAAVVLSHAHVDHAGNLPYLVKHGFVGPIYCTPATRDLAALLLMDSARIQEEDAAYWNKKHPDEPIQPYYDQHDARTAQAQFVGVNYDRPFAVRAGLSCRFAEAGHILGSTSVLLAARAEDAATPEIRLCYTGDLGRTDLPILRDPAPLPDCDYLIAEATYGNRRHEPPEDTKAKLARVIRDTVARGGRLVVPAFSVGRTQAMIYRLREIFRERLVPELDIFVDSPLAVRATAVFRAHPEAFDRDAVELERTLGGDLFACPRCHYITRVEDSKALNERTEPCIIMSASGMCEAGRILHHLKHAAPDRRNTILVVGFMAANTLGRRIVERQPQIKIFGKNYPLRAQVVQLNGFSSHADAAELDAALFPMARRVQHLFLVHGEPAQAEPLADRCRAAGFAQVSYPQDGDRFELGGTKVLPGLA